MQPKLTRVDAIDAYELYIRTERVYTNAIPIPADASADLEKLTSAVKKYNRVADITAGIINIGVGLAAQNAAATLKAAGGLATASAGTRPNA